MNKKNSNPADGPAAGGPLLSLLQDRAAGIPDADLKRIAARAGVLAGFDATPAEALRAAVRAAAELIPEEPAHSRLAARLLDLSIAGELARQGILRLGDAIDAAARRGLLQPRVVAAVRTHALELEAAIEPSRTDDLDYPGLRALYDNYLLRDPDTQVILEGPQHFWMRIAVSLGHDVPEAIGLYQLMSSLEYLPSDETLRHAGLVEEHLTSCYLLDSPTDSREAINERYDNVDRAARTAGDVTLAWHRSRMDGSLAEGDDGAAPRAGIACVYLEPWHADIERYLDALEDFDPELGSEPPPNLANWLPDLFMRRVESGTQWSLFDPADVPVLPDLYGEEFDAAYAEAEARGLARRTLPARDLYRRMLEAVVGSGRVTIEFKDNSNRACNQTAVAANRVHASNLCAEVVGVTSAGEPAVCHLGAINLARHVTGQGFDFDKLARTVALAVRQLDRAIDVNAYAMPDARASSLRWRAVGLGLMGLQDVFFRLRLPFDSFDARQLSTRISEAIYFHALGASVELARTKGRHAAFADTRVARGELQFDSWGITPSDAFDWANLRESIRAHGLRNSLLVAIGPTASLSTIAGCFDCIEPQISNFFVREVAGGDVAQVNPYLVEELRQLGLWSEATRSAIRLAGGSVQGLYQLPDDVRTVFRTAWEVSTLALIDLAADRGAFVDQSQSLSLFVQAPELSQVSRLYLYAWKCGLKTTYALHTRWPQAGLGGSSRAEA